MRRSIFGALSALLLLSLAPATGFAQDESEDDGSGGAATFEIDPAHTKIMARADHFGIGHAFVEFPEVSGTIEYNEDDITKSSINLTIKTGSLTSHQKKRDKHLKGPDFFNAKKYPEITFESTSVERVDDETLQVEGDISMHGNTETIAIKIKEIGSGKGPQGNFRRGFYTEFEINRLNFGIDWKPEAVDKMVRLILSMEGIEK